MRSRACLSRPSSPTRAPASLPLLRSAAVAIDAFLLTRRWWDSPRGLELEFWAHAAEGPVRIRVTGGSAVCFVESQVATEGGARKGVKLRSLNGKDVETLYFSSQRELVRERERLLSMGQSVLEADIKPSDRFLMERFITGGLRIEGGATEREGFRDLLNPGVHPCEVTPRLRSLSFDIETERFDGALLSIAISGCGDDRVWMVGEGPAHTLIRYCPDARATLEAFATEVRVRDPDLLIGWNVVDFDLTQLVLRAKRLGTALNLGRDGRAAEVLPSRGSRQPSVARVPGRVVLDGIAAMRTAAWSFESFALEDVAQELLGRGKRIDKATHVVAEIVRLYTEDKPALAEYNIEDCRLVADIFERAELVRFLVERQQLTGLPMDRQGGSVAAFDHLYLPRLHRCGYVAPSTGASGDIVTSPGGYVMESVPGLYDNVLVLDFKSLYPSIIRTFRIDPMGLAVPGDDPIAGFEGGTFSREAHILPELIESLWRARDSAKARKDAASSQAIKILMNSFYGVLGSPGCRFFSPRLASSITRRGHEIIKRSAAFIEARGYRVLYGDTDSVFVLVGAGHSEESCLHMGAGLARELNDYWRRALMDEHRLESQLESEFETHYLRFFMPTTRGSERGSKKRYAGSVRHGDELVVVFKGMEAVRTDWTPLAREFQRELFRRIFFGEPHEQYVASIARDLRAGKLDHALLYRKRLGRDASEYTKNVPPHVQATRKLATPGRRIAYYMTVNGPEPAEQRRSALDYHHYQERQLAPAADAILQCLGTSFAALGGQQLSLFLGPP